MRTLFLHKILEIARPLLNENVNFEKYTFSPFCVSDERERLLSEQTPDAVEVKGEPSKKGIARGGSETDSVSSEGFLREQSEIKRSLLESHAPLQSPALPSPSREVPAQDTQPALAVCGDEGALGVSVKRQLQSQLVSISSSTAGKPGSCFGHYVLKPNGGHMQPGPSCAALTVPEATLSTPTLSGLSTSAYLVPVQIPPEQAAHLTRPMVSLPSMMGTTASGFPASTTSQLPHFVVIPGKDGQPSQLVNITSFLSGQTEAASNFTTSAGLLAGTFTGSISSVGIPLSGTSPVALIPLHALPSGTLPSLLQLGQPSNAATAFGPTGTTTQPLGLGPRAALDAQHAQCGPEMDRHSKKRKASTPNTNAALANSTCPASHPVGSSLQDFSSSCAIPLSRTQLSAAPAFATAAMETTATSEDLKRLICQPEHGAAQQGASNRGVSSMESAAAMRSSTDIGHMLGLAGQVARTERCESDANREVRAGQASEQGTPTSSTHSPISPASGLKVRPLINSTCSLRCELNSISPGSLNSSM